jgi:hypothetical protein
MANKIINLENGAIIEFNPGQRFYLACCDCGLTHKIEVLKIEDSCHLRIIRDEKHTKSERRTKGIKCQK